MRKGRRSAERLSYWPELGSGALTRREEMPRWFAVNKNCFPMAAEAVIALGLMLLIIDVADRFASTRASAYYDQRHSVSC